MKRRVRKIANFFAFNLLFFALYLNFIHKDKVAASPVDNSRTTAFSETVLVDNQSPDKKNAVTASADNTVATPDHSEPLRLSIN